eukprot:scaffold1621_cov54-Phaeocystis_antarctica.AAC.3
MDMGLQQGFEWVHATRQVDIEQLDELLVEQPELGARVPARLACGACCSGSGWVGTGRWAAGRRAGALLQDGCEAPALQLAHAADHGARPVAAQAIDDHLLRHRLPWAPLADVLAQVDQLDLPVVEPLEKVGRRLVGRQVDDLAQVQFLEERQVELVGLAGAVQVCLDHPEVRGRNEAHVPVLCVLCSGCRARLGRGDPSVCARAPWQNLRGWCWRKLL